MHISSRSIHLLKSVSRFVQNKQSKNQENKGKHEMDTFSIMHTFTTVGSRINTNHKVCKHSQCIF